MAGLLVVREAEAADECRVVPAADHHQPLLAQRGVLQVGRVEVQVVDGQVQGAALQAREHAVGIVTLCHQFHLRRDVRQVRLQRRQQRRLGVVVERQIEDMWRIGGEGLRRTEAGLQQVQRLADRRVERQGARCRRHATGGALEQLLAQLLAQAGEGIAHGRLAQVQTQGGTGQVAFLHQRVEDQQQVEVELAQIRYQG